MIVVIDASVAVKWFIPEADSHRALRLVADHHLRAPSLLIMEVGNAIWKKLRRGELSEQLDILARHADLGSVVEIVDHDAAPLMARALELALWLDHAIYDCVYLAVAEMDRDVLVTADDEFRRKVARTRMAHFVTPLAG